MIAIKGLEMPKCCAECNMTTCKGEDEPWNYVCSINLKDIDFNETKRAEHCPLVEIVTCEDAVSRKAVLDTKVLIELPDGQSFYCIEIKDVENLPPVIPQPEKVCVANVHFDEDKLKEICKNATITILDNSNVPTIEPKIGHWITRFHGFPPEPTTVCSECGFDRDYNIRPRYYHKIKFCPICGAEMEVEE